MPHSYSHDNLFCGLIQALARLFSLENWLGLPCCLHRHKHCTGAQSVSPVIKTPPQVVVQESVSINSHHICILLWRPTPAAVWMDRLSDVKQLVCQSKALLMARSVGWKWCAITKGSVIITAACLCVCVSGGTWANWGIGKKKKGDAVVILTAAKK